MAKGPGPIIALAGLAALLLMSRDDGDDGGTKKVDPSDKDGIDDADDGDVVDDGKTDDDGGAKSGGTKVPKGTGTGGGGWKKPVDHPPELAWISPDCQAVHEPIDWYDDVFVPKALAFYAKVEALTASARFPHIVAYGEATVDSSLDPFDLLALVLGIKDVRPNGTPMGTVVFSDAPFMDTYPWACLKTFPGFQLTTKYYGLDPELSEETDLSSGAVQAKFAQFHSDMKSWAQEFPELAVWLQSFYTRFVWDTRIGEDARFTGSEVYPGALWADLTKDAPAWFTKIFSHPPNKPADPSFEDLQDPAKAATWFAAISAWAKAHRDNYPWVRAWFADIKGWYDSQSRNGAQAPIPPGADVGGYSEMAPDNPIATSTLHGRVLGAGGLPVSNVEVIGQLGDATTMTDSNGYFELTLPLGWNNIEFRKGSHLWGEQVQVEPWASAFVEIVNVEIAAPSSSGIISGQVVGALQQPAAGVTAWSEFGSAVTDQDGRFELRMSSGDQQLELTRGPLIWWAGVNVRANQTVSVVIDNPDLGSDGGGI